jgi:hypothetical protein
MSARFLHPAAAIQEFQEDKIDFMPPQYYILFTLCDILIGNENTLLQRERIEMLSQGAFGRMVINPIVMPERDAEGRVVMTYEGDETHGGPKGRLHRALATPRKSGVGLCSTIRSHMLTIKILYAVSQTIRAHTQF